MKAFTLYLLHKGIDQPDIIYWVNKHRRWCQAYGTTPVTIKFNEIVVYVEHLMFQYQDSQVANNIIAKVTYYYDYLLACKKIRRNLFSYQYIEKEKQRIYAHITGCIKVPNYEPD